MSKLITLLSILTIGLINPTFSALSIPVPIPYDSLSQPRVVFAAYNFYHPEEGNYVELYLSFDATSLMHQKVGDYYQAKLEILYLIKKNDKIVKYDKFEVLGPEIQEEGLYQDFMDVQTYTLKPGEYTLEISVTDANKQAKPVTASQRLIVDIKEKQMRFSDITFKKEVSESTDSEGQFVKNGLFMTPWLISTMPKFMDYIYLYTEVYNSDYELGKSGAYVEKHTLVNIDVDSVFASYSVIKRVKTNNVNIILKKIDLTKLPTGGYIYTIDLMDRNNKIVASEGKQFYRESTLPSLQKMMIAQGMADFTSLIHSQTSRDTIVDYFRCIGPLGGSKHQDFIDRNWKSSSAEILKQYIVSFWTDYKPEKSLEEWLRYRQLVAVVNKEFGNSIQKGYDTDRGRVYLKYGAPDQIVVRENEPSSYPYIIWQYYAHPVTSNAMYVFYDPSLTYRDYVLLHSNVRGEKSNDRWKLILQSRNNPNSNIDTETGVDHWGGEVDDYYENPR